MGKGVVLLVVVSLIAVPAGDWGVVVPGCTCKTFKLWILLQ